jgi:hypothetical protein
LDDDDSRARGVGERDIMTYIRNKKKNVKRTKEWLLKKIHCTIASIIRCQHYILCAFMAMPRFISFTSSQSQSIEKTKNKKGGIEEKFAPLYRKNLLDPNFFVPFTLFLLFALFYIVLGLYLFSASIVCYSLYSM